MLLAGDVGATKTLLGLFERADARPRAIDVRPFTTLDFPTLGDMIAAFMFAERTPRRPIEAACFGVAGPVINQVARLTNVPWRVDAAEISDRFSIPAVKLLNDLEAMAHVVPALERHETAVLQDGRAAGGNAALIAAGTGLGEALLHEIDGVFVPAASEGGHADFAPRTDREIELLRELRRLYGRARWEDVLSGPGLVNVHRFVHGGECAGVDVSDPAAAPSNVSRAALDRRCPRCIEALDLFVAAYGAEAGNVALRYVATAGVYVGGGIAPKILPALETGPFMEAFRNKPPASDLLAAIPVIVILNQRAGLLGAAVYADRLARGSRQ